MKYEVKDLETKRTLGYSQNMSAARLQATRFTTLARVGVFLQGAERPFLVLNHGIIVASAVAKAVPAPKKGAARVASLSNPGTRQQTRLS